MILEDVLLFSTLHFLLAKPPSPRVRLTSFLREPKVQPNPAQRTYLCQEDVMSRDLRISISGVWAISCGAAALCLMANAAAAATLCVNQHSNTGCYSSITSALAAANAGDVINVAQGTYAEDVLITKPISLVGGNQMNTIIDASGKSNGIYIDGLDTPGLGGVTVRGFTVQNAN
ncbi:MAG TPA: DUF1565 domain-containing protein, partial [Acidobacteriaceae bacterium]|nr:DUF1565 domain-containing protein [Acidobacteriaceae bacterium]